jgi:hypothetical protein
MYMYVEDNEAKTLSSFLKGYARCPHHVNLRSELHKHVHG